MGVLIDTGFSEYQIVTPGRFCPAENHAALHLQKYLYEMTGAMLPVRWGDRLIPRNPAIRVGLSRYEPRGLWDKDWYEIRPEGTDLKLFGCNSRCAHYAVFAFLESLGARFHGPGEERWPHLARVDMPAKPIRSTAAFGMRHVFYPTAEEPEWAIRWKLNVHDGRDERWGENAAPHTVANNGTEAARISPRANPEWHMAVFDNNSELDLLGPDGRWRTLPVNPDGRSSRDVIYRDADMPAGAWRLRSGKSGFVVNGTFDAAAAAYVKMAFWMGRSIRLEVHFHDQELAPRAGVVFATRWRSSRPRG